MKSIDQQHISRIGNSVILAASLILVAPSYAAQSSGNQTISPSVQQPVINPGLTRPAPPKPNLKAYFKNAQCTNGTITFKYRVQNTTGDPTWADVVERAEQQASLHGF